MVNDNVLKKLCGAHVHTPAFLPHLNFSFLLVPFWLNLCASFFLSNNANKRSIIQ